MKELKALPDAAIGSEEKRIKQSLLSVTNHVSDVSKKKLGRISASNPHIKNCQVI